MVRNRAVNTAKIPNYAFDTLIGTQPLPGEEPSVFVKV